MTNTTADLKLGALVPPAALNRHHLFRWTVGDAIAEQDMRIVEATRPDLFPTGPLWRRIDLGACLLFVKRSTV
jgi:hypothetical protein